MKLITAREHSTEYRFSVHIDEAQRLPDASPDPAYVVEYRWPKQPPEGQSPAAYLASIQREMRLLAQLRLAEAAPGTPLLMEGATL